MRALLAGVAARAIRLALPHPDGRPTAERPAGQATTPGAAATGSGAGGRLGPFDELPDSGPKGFVARFARQRNLRFLGRTLQVVEHFSRVHGNSLAAAVTLQSFIAIFPLLLLVIAVVGFVAAGGTDVAGEATRQLGLSGPGAELIHEALDAAVRSRRATSVVGLAGLLWSGLGVVTALQYGFAETWGVRTRGLRGRAVGLLWLIGAGMLLVAGSVVTTALRWLPGPAAPFGALVGVAVSFGVWTWTLRTLPNVALGFRDVLPGAVVGTVGFELLKVVGGYYAPRIIASSSAVYGSLGVVFAVLAWLLFFGRLVIYSTATNVVFHRARHGVPPEPRFER